MEDIGVVFVSVKLIARLIINLLGDFPDKFFYQKGQFKHIGVTFDIHLSGVRFQLT
jgi:hypothetical protein